MAQHDHRREQAQQDRKDGTKETIGFVGLGGMGAAMAANLLRAGYPLTENLRHLVRYTVQTPVRQLRPAQELLNLIVAIRRA